MTSAPGIASKYAPGDTVVVRAIYPDGHIRTPFYIRGKKGTIERICGAFRNPEELAFGKYDAKKILLYRVRFDQTDVWPDYDGSRQDKVDVEIFEHWLEPAGSRLGE
ncbi:MAG: SH3-like domain-containing protein [Methyloligellaceae bacterium]